MYKLYINLRLVLFRNLIELNSPCCMDWVSASAALAADDDDDELMLAAFHLPQSNAVWLMVEVVLDGRFDPQKEHARMICSDWWRQIDSIDHDLSGEFKRTFRMS